jgi:thymidylate synthase
VRQYLDLLRTVLDQGAWQENRTGVRTRAISGAMLRFDLAAGFPAVTTKRLAFKSAMGELCAFLRGATSAATFRALGCRVWDANANANAQWLTNPYRQGEDDLGPVYGAQWRHWPAVKLLHESQTAAIARAEQDGYRHLATGLGPAPETAGRCLVLYRAVDQLRECLDKIRYQPSDRRILFHAWNPAQLEEMALPPCHLLYQFNVNVADRELSLCLYQRSVDTFLGLPWNLAEGAAVLTLFARLTGYRPRWLTWFGADVHLYETHLDAVGMQLTRDPLPLPTLRLGERIPAFADTGRYEPEWLESVEPGDFVLEGYQHHPAIAAEMAI